MNDLPDKPKIRPVEAIPLETDGRRMVILRDGAGLSDAQLILSPTAFFIITLFDGTRTLRDMQVEYMRKVGEVLPTEKLEEIVQRLDDAFLLDGPRFQEHYREIVEAFRRSDVRPSSLAGQAYEGDPEKLRVQLDGYFTPPDGPGAPAKGKREERLRGLIAPHIDLARGGPSYAAAWAPAGEGPKPDAVVILGTAHSGAADTLYIGTRKGFETPFGKSPLDRDLADRLASRAGEALFEEEFVHAKEHSVEFQVLFAQHAFGPDIPIVPLLACSFHEFILGEMDPWEDDRIRGFVEGLREAVEASGKRVLFVASADLAHVGPKFGDTTEANDTLLDAVRRSDMDLLKSAGQLDATDFYQKIARQGDRTRVCGFPCIYTLLRVLEGSGARGMLRKYGNTVDPTKSAVTFAGMTFE
ncbi:MAG: AmmeMemoRadiSam system protein B [Planctomycetota bacterium]|jgi:AmmeMemoRadiSam system protein B